MSSAKNGSALSRLKLKKYHLRIGLTGKAAEVLGEYKAVK
jgi:hypothetical protein